MPPATRPRATSTPSTPTRTTRPRTMRSAAGPRGGGRPTAAPAPPPAPPATARRAGRVLVGVVAAPGRRIVAGRTPVGGWDVGEWGRAVALAAAVHRAAVPHRDRRSVVRIARDRVEIAEKGGVAHAQRVAPEVD